MQIDLRVLELLSSKVCHDLISPVSAINNGVELIEDIGGSVVDEAMKLIANSAIHSSRLLRVFRIAYGRAGSEENLPVRDVRLVMGQYFEKGKIRLVWPDEVVLPEISQKKGGLKTLINSALMAEELLAYGGVITFEHYKTEGRSGCRILVEGRSAQLSPSFEFALKNETPVEELTPRTVQSYVTGLFSRHFDLQISHETPKEDRLDILLSVSLSEYDDPPKE